MSGYLDSVRLSLQGYTAFEIAIILEVRIKPNYPKSRVCSRVFICVQIGSKMSLMSVLAFFSRSKLGHCRSFCSRPNQKRVKANKPMAPSSRFDKKWVSVPILILLLTSVISCAALEEAQQRRQERIKRKLAGHTTPPDMPIEEFPLRGQPAPLFTLQDLDGNQVSLAELRGKPVVINFWATWCGPCRMEVPYLEHLSKKYKDRGLVVLGVNNESNHQVVREFARTQISYTVLLDGHLPFLDYDVRGIPCTYYIGKDGIIRDRDVGFNGEVEMERKISNLFSSS